MDAVEIPAVSTTGTDLSIGRSNHQNLSPTDSFGDVEIGTPRTCPDTSDEASPLGLSATRSGEQMQPPVDVSATKSGEQMQFFSNVEDGNGAAIPLRLPCSGSFDDHSDMGMDDHLYKDSGSLSEGEEDETGWKRDAVFGSDSQETDLDQNISSPALSHDRKQPPEKVRDDDVQSTGSHGLLPNPSSMDGALASFDGVWDMTVSTSFPGSPILFSHSNGGESMKSANGMASDDDLSDNEQDFPTRRALFRGDPAVSGLANSEGSANEERKKENGQTETEIPPIEQVPSNDSYGSFCEYITPSNLQIPIPMTKRESFATITSEYTYDDDSTTGDNVCPICLCGYKKGDMLVVSNHCTHCFHKDCILEWLDKHDECPICRVNMITDSELSRAATSLVGKTRMYRAVATMQTSSSRGNSRYHRSPNAATGANPSGPSPLGGTVRSSAAGSRTPPRGYQNPRAFS